MLLVLHRYENSSAEDGFGRINYCNGCMAQSRRMSTRLTPTSIVPPADVMKPGPAGSLRGNSLTGREVGRAAVGRAVMVLVVRPAALVVAAKGLVEADPPVEAAAVESRGLVAVGEAAEEEEDPVTDCFGAFEFPFANR